jgi:hypothetical protein
MVRLVYLSGVGPGQDLELGNRLLNDLIDGPTAERLPLLGHFRARHGHWAGFGGVERVTQKPPAEMA